MKFFFVLLSIAYPAAVFCCLVLFNVPIKIFSLFIVFIALVYLLLFTGNKKRNWKFLASAALLLSGGIICLATGRTVFIKLYPVLMNIIFLFTFGSTLFVRPNICFRFACLADKKLPDSHIARRVENYCLKVTVIWCVFFILNGAAALYTVLCKSDKIWSIYNGGISYVLMGVLFTAEFFIRMIVNSKMPKIIYLTKFNAKSRPMDTVLCYENKWSDKKYLTWKDFLTETAKMRLFLSEKDRQNGNIDSYILHCEDYWYFLCTFAALLQCKKQVCLTANISEGFISEIRSGKNLGFLTDQDLSKTTAERHATQDFDFIPAVFEKREKPAEEEILTTPEINADETRILMFTSGSTGHPKAVPQRMTEFELDNQFIFSKWFDEFSKRKLCAVNSQHHIYGFLFTVSIPFAAAVPFRRKRITLPDEFYSLDDVPYMIIAVPAFLKRTCAEVLADGEDRKLPLKEPFIFTSGGAVRAELARDTEKVFGFCPLEVYGSTETSGIAYRQQTVNGMVWTPFDNAKIWPDKDDGCLTIISPYIKDPAGFKTGDLAEFYEDGRFLLKGRADSIVKIEEKRISVTEVENRLLQTGLISECAVVPMSDRRQYLAAAVVLNSEGCEKFKDTEKYLINRFFHDYLLQFFENVVLPKKWRYLEDLPKDLQGKKKKPEIQKLFASPNPHGIPAETVMSRKETQEKTEVELEVKIPLESDYFDGHFPELKILPAVALIDLTAHFASRYFGVKASCPDIKRFKFSEKILPGRTLVIKMKHEAASNKVSFEVSDFSGRVFASGTYTAQKDI